MVSDIPSRSSQATHPRPFGRDRGACVGCDKQRSKVEHRQYYQIACSRRPVYVKRTTAVHRFAKGIEWPQMYYACQLALRIRNETLRLAGFSGSSSLCFWLFSLFWRFQNRAWIHCLVINRFRQKFALFRTHSYSSVQAEFRSISFTIKNPTFNGGQSGPEEWITRAVPASSHGFLLRV